MRHVPVSFERTVRAFRDLTAMPADGAATRARVLARAGRSAARRLAVWRTSLAIGAALVALSSASVALTAGARRWRAPAPVTLAVESALVSKASNDERAHRQIPFEAAAPAAAAGVRSADAENRAYGRAHRAHFVDDAPGRALGAWNDYLDGYPQGVFAPEARYNRALCLVRLGRLDEALHALRPFARATPDGYRQTEARLLLEWVHERQRGRRDDDATARRQSVNR